MADNPTVPSATRAPSIRHPLTDRALALYHRLGALFVWVVLVPSLSAIVYLGFWASDVYISDSKYIIRSAQNPLSTQTDYTLQSFLGTPAIMQDSFVVSNYITSMDGLKTVNQTINLKELFTNKKIDLFSRFASIYWNSSQERLLKYFNKHIEIIVDPISFVSTLHVKSYDAKSAQEINERLLQGSEKLVNDLNERTRQDIIRFSEKGVETARLNLEKAELAILNFKNRQNKGGVDVFIPKFQALSLERDTAERQLGAALEALRQAQIEAQRKMIYLERIAQPQLPDYPIEPYRIFGILTTIVLSLMIFGILKIILASIREHQD